MLGDTRKKLEFYELVGDSDVSYVRLSRAMIELAIRDYRLGAGKKHNSDQSRNYHSAKAFLSSSWLHWWCIISGDNPEHIKRKSGIVKYEFNLTDGEVKLLTSLSLDAISDILDQCGYTWDDLDILCGIGIELFEEKRLTEEAMGA